MPREARQARNEVLFREINQRIARGSDSQVGSRLLVICECDKTGCEAMISLSVDDYRRVRSNPRRFAIFPGHNDPEIEDIVETHDGYQIVEKHSDVLVGN
jgi:hypothetical protein